MSRAAQAVLFAALGLSALADGPPEGPGERVHSPAEAITSAERGPQGDLGTYPFVVKGAKVIDRMLYLNSEEDDRSPACLTVRCEETATRMLARRFGGAPAADGVSPRQRDRWRGSGA